MGGCCCCSSRAAVINNAPPYYYYPRALQERVTLSSHQGHASVGLLVDTNLDTSIPDAYRPPPAPIPFDVTVGCSQSQACAHDSSGDRNNGVPTKDSGSIQQTADVNNRETSDKCEVCKADDNTGLDSAKELEVEHLDLAVEEDDCPICLEEYDKENPKFTTKCEHDFHLACVLEWIERSETCPVCDKELTLEFPID